MLTRIVSAVAATLFFVVPLPSTPQAATPPAAGTIACRALESHIDDELKVAIVVFHQRDEAQRSQLATLLREHSGDMVEVQTADGAWRRARMVRLKSCFGRGLLLLPVPVPFADRAEFALRLPADTH